MGKIRSVENFRIIYGRLVEILSFEVRNSQKLANRQVTSFSTNNHLRKSRSYVTSGWSVISGMVNYG